MNIIQALDDPTIFGSVIRDPSTWGAWRGFLKALFALPMDDTEAELFRRCTGRATLPATPFNVAQLCCGRRAGKSFALALIAVFLACFRDYEPFLAMGEKATIVVVAADRRQARVIFRYCRGILQSVPALRGLIEGETNEELRLTNGVNIEVMTASSRSIRGYAIPVALLDEAAWWSVEGSADADVEIVGGLVPAMKQFGPLAVRLSASSPYGRRGAFWDDYKTHYGKDDSTTLVWQAATWVMNPTIPLADLNAEFAADPARASAEYGATFRTDLEAFVSRDVIEASVEPGRYELPPVAGMNYIAAVDPSGSGADAMTLAIGHREDEQVVIDAVRSRRPPFSPETVVGEFCDLLKTYNIRKVTGDRYAGEFAREPFRKAGIEYELTDRSASDIFREALPYFNSARVDLLDIPQLIAELIALERRTSRVGKDSIGHPPSGHDDLAVVVCLVIYLTLAKDGSNFDWGSMVSGGDVQRRLEAMYGGFH